MDLFVDVNSILLLRSTHWSATTRDSSCITPPFCMQLHCSMPSSLFVVQLRYMCRICRIKPLMSCSSWQVLQVHDSCIEGVGWSKEAVLVAGYELNDCYYFYHHNPIHKCRETLHRHHQQHCFVLNYALLDHDFQL